MFARSVVRIGGVARFSGRRGVAQEAYSLSALRRDRERQGWKRATWWYEEDDADEDMIPFPRERHGRNYETNWSMNVVSVTPQRDAFRNLHPRGLVMVAGGKLTASKTLISNMKHPEAPPANIQMEDGESSKKNLLKGVRKALSSIPRLFVRDATIGALSSIDSRFRVITDCPHVALALEHMMFDAVEGTSPESFCRKPTKTALVCSSFPAELAEEAGVSKRFALFKPETDNELGASSTVLAMGGPVRSTHVLQALAAAANMDSETRALVAGHGIVHGNKSVLVLEPEGGNQVLAYGEKSAKSIHAAHHTIWDGALGLVPAWKGVQVHAKGTDANVKGWSASFGDLFEIDDNVTTLTRGLDRSSGQRVAHPSAIIVLKKGGKKPIIAVKASDMSKELSDSASKLIAANKTKIFQVDPSADGVDVSTVVAQALEGKLKA